MENVEDIQHIVNQIFEEAKEGESAFERNMDFRKRLKAIGPNIVAPILAELFAKKKANELSLYQKYVFGSPIFHLIDAVVELAKPEHAQQLAEMLLWDEITAEEDRSKHSLLLDALTRVGDASVIPLLKKFAKKVKRVKYTYVEPFDEDDRPCSPVEPFDEDDRPCSPSELHEIDQEAIKATIKACKQRSKTPLQKTQE
jgi:DUF438 domain-containing protein